MIKDIEKIDKTIKSRRESGITLVALVVTIVVLLLLAIVTINMVLGENGIIARAKDAKQVQEIEKIKEELQLAIHALQVDYNMGNEAGTFRDYIFSTAPGKGQKKLKADLGADNLVFDSANNKIRYKGIDFNVAEDGTLTVNGEGGNGGGISGEINWERIMATAQKHPDQTSTNDIGIDANGNVVNLDLWLYDTYQDGYVLGDGYSCYDGNVCYLPLGERASEFPSNIEKENIVCVQYIKAEGDSDFIPVIEIGNDAFSGCSTIRTLIIPDTVNTIGWCAFKGCSNIQSLVFPSLITEISYEAFSGCTSLNNLVLEVSSYSTGVFKGCERLCPHEYRSGYCDICESECNHPSWNNGECTRCGVYCEDTYSDEFGGYGHFWVAGVCSCCHLQCNHDWSSDGYCWICGMECNHPSWSNGECTKCHMECEYYESGHQWNNGVCSRCHLQCNHDWTSDGYCSICGMECNHTSWTNGVCNRCHLDCEEYYGHDWSNGVCRRCNTHCSHDWSYDGYCYNCGIYCNHPSKTDGVCDVCGYDTINASN